MQVTRHWEFKNI